MSAAWPTLDGKPPRIIAHRGASGLMPEHTLEGYALALEQGADVIEPDLVCTRDGHLVCRHDRNLARSTDIATRPEFSARRRERDWWVEDFDLAELSALRAVQPFPARDHACDGRYRIPSFAGALLWAENAAKQRKARVLLYPELKSPAYFTARGADPLTRFSTLAMQRNPARVELWLQSFEVEPLVALREAAEVPVFLLLDHKAPWRRLLPKYAGKLDGFGVDKCLLQDVDGSSSGLVEQAHDLGLQIHAFTYRDDHPAAGFASVLEELDVAFAIGVDALFCDFPATALRWRDGFQQQ
ncbi:MAG: glycerophosphodiester phosphodiesterase family protein [Lysobacteraceae bacterium]